MVSGIFKELRGVLKWQLILSDSKLLFYLLLRGICEQGSEGFKGSCTGESPLRNYLFWKVKQHSNITNEISSAQTATEAQKSIFFFFHERLQLWLSKNDRNICHSSCCVALLSLYLCASNGMCLLVCCTQPVIILVDTYVVFPERLAAWSTSELLTHLILTVGEEELFL